MEFSVVFEKSYNSILTDIDYWLSFYKGMNKEKREQTKNEFVQHLRTQPANHKTVSEITVEYFNLKPMMRVYFDETEFVKSRLETSNDQSQKLYISLDYEKINNVFQL